MAIQIRGGRELAKLLGAVSSVTGSAKSATGGPKRRRLKPRQPWQPTRTAEAVTFTLPWPVSENDNHHKGGGHVYLDRSVRKYRRAVEQIAQELDLPRISCERLRVRVFCYQPDNRVRDLGNLDKCLMDAWQRVGIIRNDGDIDDQRFIRIRGALKDGKPLGLHIVVEIGRHDPWGAE